MTECQYCHSQTNAKVGFMWVIFVKKGNGLAAYHNQ